MQDSEYTFVFADLAGFTALTEAHGDEGGASVAIRFHDIARSALCGATLVKTLGDGVMVVCSGVEQGVRVAEGLLRGVSEQHHFPRVRIGVHAGRAVVRDGDYFGRAVNVTSRVMEAAKPGQVLCTEHIANVATSVGLARATPIGPVRMKNVVEPIVLFELSFGCPSQPLMFLDPVCRMQFDPGVHTVSLEYEGALLHFCSEACAEKFAREPETHLRAISPYSAPGTLVDDHHGG